MICVDLNVNIAKMPRTATTLRDCRKLRSNPQFFLNELSKVEWEIFVNMEDIDDMEHFWSTQINKCLDVVAPWKSQKFKQKRYQLPKEVQVEIKKQKVLLKRHKTNVLNGQIDMELETEFKKHRNFCNNLIKKAVREKNGANITSVNNVKQVFGKV